MDEPRGGGARLSADQRTSPLSGVGRTPKARVSVETTTRLSQGGSRAAGGLDGGRGEVGERASGRAQQQVGAGNAWEGVGERAMWSK